MAAALIALAVGGGLKAYGNYKGLRNHAKQLDRESLLKSATAAEIRYRSDIEQMRIEKTGREVKGEQITEIAGSGRGLSGTTAFSILEQTSRDIATEVVNEARQSMFEANIKDIEAANLKRQAKQMKKASHLKLFSDVLSMGGSAYTKSPGGKS